MVEERVSFKDMCARFDVTPRTLRYYEYIELLAPEREGRTRYYGPRDVARMTLILRGRRFGFSLEEIRRWLLIYDEEGTRAQMEELLRLADMRLAALVEEQRALALTVEELRHLREAVARQLEG